MKLFQDYNLSDVIHKHRIKLFERIDKYTNNELMANDLDLLAERCFEDFKIEAVEIGEEENSKRSIKQSKIERNNDIDGIVAHFYFQFSGDPMLFKCRASTFSVSGYPDIEIDSKYIVFTYIKTLSEMNSEEGKQKLLKSLAHDLESVKSGISYANNQVNAFNASLKIIPMVRLIERKKKVEQFFAISQIFEVPLQKTEYAVTHIPMQRKIIPIATTYNSEPTFSISEDEYRFILETIKHNGSTYERTPNSFRGMHEEDIRNILLAALNGMYKGGATGETFRHKGKTDICIETENRAAFIAECKMWTGKATLQKDHEQLDRYLTWRDCKVALIYFVGNKDFINVCETVKQSLYALPSLRQIKPLDMNELEYNMISVSNPGQFIKVHIMLFHLCPD